MKKIAGLISIIFLLSINTVAQHANDTLLFSIAMNSDTASIYGCVWNDKIRSTLAGPVLMADNTLLFYSQNGYVLYNKKGKLLDSHSLFKENKKAIKRGEAPTRLAYPLDSTIILYYKKSAQSQSPEVFQKKLFKKDLKKSSNDVYAIYSEIESGQLFNLASNSITDEMNRRSFLLPQLVGYTALDEGVKWWTTDKFYSFSSPLLIEDKGKCISFFPGLKSDQQCEVKKHLIEPLGVFNMEGRWYYCGLYSSLGNIEDEYYQVLMLCDQAGNILYRNQLLKQEITDAVLQHVKASNTNFTVRRAARHVFVPAIDKNGDIFYGMIDFEYKRIKVFKREFYRFLKVASGPVLQKLFRDEGDMAYTPVTLECNSAARRGVSPEVAQVTDEGIVSLEEHATVKNGFFVKIHRLLDEELKKKLQRTQRSLPQNLQSMQDSISEISTSWCPYSVSLNHDEKGQLGYLNYAMGDEIFCARILAVTSSYEIFVRVDLEKWAEIVVFSADGNFQSRFIFNNQIYRDRKDLVVVSDEREIVEKDFECTKDGYRFYRWELGAADSK